MKTIVNFFSHKGSNRYLANRIAKLLFLSLIIFIQPCMELSSSLNAQNTSVEFSVNMNYLISEERFDPETETVDIAGSFNGWGSNLTQLSDANQDGNYSVNITLAIGSTVEFKFRINGAWNGREEFPGGGPNRVYPVEKNGVVYHWYNDEFPPDALNVRIMVSTVFASQGETVHFADVSPGHPVEWEWSFPGGNPSSSSQQNPAITYNTSGIWDVSLKITNEEGKTAYRSYNSFVRIEDMKTHWWNDAVFYEIFVRSFKDSSGNGRGDFKGLIEKLDYLNDGDPSTTDDLGITGIWLMPVQESPSYHGYDATDYRKIAQDYGTNQDFKNFIQEAHKRGIRVIVDLVMNHSSSQHPWFIESTYPSSPKRDWYVWKSNNPGTTGPWGQNLWHFRNGSYYYGIFWSGMPDLNYTNPEVKDEMFEVARFWLEEMNVDGFRLDAVKYMIETEQGIEDTPETIALLKEFRNFYKSVNEDAFAVGEAWTTTDIVQQYVNDGGLDYCFEFDLASSILNAVNSSSATFLEDKTRHAYNAYPFLQFGTFLSNHDINRVMNLLGHDEQKVRQAASLLLTYPGIPYLYYGEEIGMTGVKPDENIRTPMQWNSSTHAGFTTGNPWRAVNSDYTHKNVANQQSDPNSLWHHYRNLIEIRNNEPALRRGSYKPLSSSHTSTMGFLRQYEDENILVLVNLDDNPIYDATFSLFHGGIAPGEHILGDLRHQAQTNITIDNAGGFSGFVKEEMPPRAFYIYKFGYESNDDTTVEPVLDFNIFPNPARNYIKEK